MGSRALAAKRPRFHGCCARSKSYIPVAQRKKDAMRYNLLGRTGLFVSELCLGAMTFGGKGFWQAIGDLGGKESEALVGTALDAGVNFIDTADVYSDGDSERLVGAALKSLGR